MVWGISQQAGNKQGQPGFQRGQQMDSQNQQAGNKPGSQGGVFDYPGKGGAGETPRKELKKKVGDRKEYREGERVSRQQAGPGILMILHKLKYIKKGVIPPFL